jgi:glutamyl-tRNA synthetase
MPTDGTLVVHDALRGAIEFDAAQMDDQVLIKSDGFPTYHLANVVDDHLMRISHVIRAEEWIPSLPKHVRMYEAFGWPRPEFCHLPLLRNADRSKISKRKNPVSINHYRRAGFLPAAMLNYLALMGWTMPDEREEFTLEEFIDGFDLGRISLGGPVFDVDKLTWLNGRWIRRTPVGELRGQLRSDLLSDAYLDRVLELAHERVDTLESFMSYAQPFFLGDVEYDDAARRKLVAKDLTPPQTAKALRLLVEDHLDPLMEWTSAHLEQAVQAWCRERELEPKQVFMSIRVAVTGRTATPPLFDTMEVLGKEICRRRLRSAVDVLRTMKE